MKNARAHREQTLRELEGMPLPEMPPRTGMVARCKKLIETPIARFSPDGLRLMISQQLGLRHLVPEALALLKAEPLLEAGYFPGDLLEAVLGVPGTFWEREHQLSSEPAFLLQKTKSLPQDIRAKGEAFLQRRITMQLTKGC